MIINPRFSIVKFCTGLLATCCVSACNINPGIQPLSLDDSVITPTATLHRPVSESIYFIASAQMLSGQSDSALVLSGFSPGIEPNTRVGGLEGLPRAKFRYDDVSLAGYGPQGDEESGSPARIFDADFDYQAVEAGFGLSSLHLDRWWFVDMALLLKVDHFAVDVVEQAPLEAPGNFNLDHKVAFLGVGYGMGVRPWEPITVRMSVKAHKRFSGDADDVQTVELDLTASYRINQWLGVDLGAFRIQRDDTSDVSPIEMDVTGARLGLSIHL